ncbi:hypothetical protein Nos7524_4647 [Nostoc sp. PCC 7524]|jgi:hypothetical protein|uniref:hypothetical protein n=1 Tax=Nostoc sp. (strain ATCC 29411 / PCC 7524) TaxID=28072 RepID=UPI00029F0858|nr:hypothetical protein [Nostoc sp. PCC 7524]AFY50392.1 hypothetical protein Nos7524_4647 [Nostoc sp. PCC 7524]
MIISDLNYFEDVTQEIVGAGGVSFKSYFYKDVDVNEKIDNKIKNKIYSDVYIKGNAAESQAVADAYGDNTKTLTLVGTQTTEYYSESFGKAISATY